MYALVKEWCRKENQDDSFSQGVLAGGGKKPDGGASAAAEDEDEDDDTMDRAVDEDFVVIVNNPMDEETIEKYFEEEIEETEFEGYADETVIDAAIEKIKNINCNKPPSPVTESEDGDEGRVDSESRKRPSPASPPPPAKRAAPPGKGEDDIIHTDANCVYLKSDDRWVLIPFGDVDMNQVTTRSKHGLGS